MKAFQLITLLCLILYSYQQCGNLNNAKKEDCKPDNLSSDEKQKGAEYCCFFKNGDSTACLPFTKYQYKNVKDIIKVNSLNFQAILSGEYNDISIDCKALYIQISLLSILLLLL